MSFIDAAKRFREKTAAEGNPRYAQYQKAAGDPFDVPHTPNGSGKGYARTALDNECAEMRRQTEPGRNAKLNECAFNLGQLVGGGELDEQEVVAALTDAARATGLGDFEIRTTLRSGLEAGKQQSRTVPPRPTGPSPAPPGAGAGPAAGESTPARPFDLDVTNPALVADWLRDELGRGRLAGMFYRAPNIVHCPAVGENGYEPLTDDGDDGPAQVRPVTASTLASRIQWTYGVFRWVGKGDDKVAVAAMFPRSAATVAVDVPDELPNLRHLRGVTHSPTIRRDGTILDAPGYDPATKLLHLPEPGLEMPSIPDTPTSDQVARAVALLDEMTAGFRFLTDHDRANYYGLLLTPLLRELAPPPYKLGAIGAPQPGSGKTLLATILRILHGGVFRSEIPEGDELRKAVSTILDVTTGPVVHFDNVTGILRSSTLAGLLTSNRWDDRRLGSNEIISRANDRLWTVTGNNLTLGGDLVRRTLWVTIDPGVPHPELRTDFAIRDLEGWARDHRGQLLAALLTLIRNWVVTGRPTEIWGGDGFARWVETVDGILRCAGIPGRFAHGGSARQGVGSDDDEWGTFLEAVHRVLGTSSWTVKDLLGYIGDARSIHPISLDDLPAELADKAAKAAVGVPGVSRSLGRWLMNRDGRWAGHLCSRRDGDDGHGTAKWRIETI